MVVTRFLPIPGSVRANACEGSGSRLGPKVDPRSGLGLDAGPERRTMARRRERGVALWGRSSQMSEMDARQAVRLPVIPSPGTRGIERWGPTPDRVNQVRSTASRVLGGSDPSRPRVLAVSGSVSRGSGCQDADVPVGLPVEDHGEKIAGGRDIADARPRRAPTRTRRRRSARGCCAARPRRPPSAACSAIGQILGSERSLRSAADRYCRGRDRGINRGK